MAILAPPHNRNAQFATVFRSAGASGPAAPVFLNATITGTPQIGETLGVTISRTGNPAPTISYQWTRDGVTIGGATGATYTLLEADAGAGIGVDIGLTNSEGSASGSSNVVTVAAVQDAFTFDSITVTFDSVTNSFDEAA